MRKTRYNAYAAACPTRQVLDRIADKWTVLIIGLLEQRPHHFGELLRGIDGISQKMLTQTLRSLEYDGLVDRRAKPTVPVTVEYSLTNAGRTTHRASGRHPPLGGATYRIGYRCAIAN